MLCKLSLPDEKGETASTHGSLESGRTVGKGSGAAQLVAPLAPTAERYALLGSYYKRRAITQRGDETARNKALGDAEAAYGMAENRPEVPDKVYHTLNRLACRCLRDMDLDPDEIKDALEVLAKIEAAVQAKQDAGLSFWERIVRPDAALGRILLNMAQGQIEHDEGAVLALYRREFEIGATARQRSTVLENLEFMALILQAKGKPDQAAVMERMLENLTA